MMAMFIEHITLEFGISLPQGTQSHQIRALCSPLQSLHAIQFHDIPSAYHLSR